MTPRRGYAYGSIQQKRQENDFQHAAQYSTRNGVSWNLLVCRVINDPRISFFALLYITNPSIPLCIQPVDVLYAVGSIPIIVWVTVCKYKYTLCIALWRIVDEQKILMFILCFFWPEIIVQAKNMYYLLEVGKKIEMEYLV